MRGVRHTERSARDRYIVDSRAHDGRLDSDNRCDQRPRLKAAAPDLADIISALINRIFPKLELTQM